MTTTKPARSARHRRALVATLAALGVSAILGSSLAAAHGGTNGDSRSPVVVKVKDDCEPTSFNAAIGPDTCVGDGDTTFGDFIGQLIAEQNAPKWRFSRSEHKVKSGRNLLAVNEGGEFHTFSEVAAFGGGCIP